MILGASLYALACVVLAFAIGGIALLIGASPANTKSLVTLALIVWPPVGFVSWLVGAHLDRRAAR